MASIRELTDEHIEMIEPFLPKVRGKKRANLKKTLNGICHVLRTGCSWRDMPTRHGHHKTAYNMCRRYSRSGVWDRVMVFLVGQNLDPEAAMADATIVKAHRTSMSMAAGVGKERAIGRSRGGPTTKLHTLSDAQGRPFGFHLTGGNVSDYNGFRELIKIMPPVAHLVADRGYDADWIRNELEKMGIQPCICGRRHRKRKIDFDEDLYKTRHRIENAFAKRKDWRHVVLRAHRCPKIFLGVVTFAAIVKFWL